MRLSTVAAAVCLLLSMCGQVSAQAVVSSLSPLTCRPGETARLSLSGKNLKDNLRIVCDLAAAQIRTDRLEAEKATFEVTLPVDAPLGPVGLWVATADGPAPPLVLLVDDLPVVTDNGGNHSRESAQSVSALCAVDGVGDGPQSDFYRFPVEAGQRVAFEVQTQAIRSAMDPVVRLWDPSGRLLRSDDDGPSGPECRFSHRFTDAGDYVIEVGDSRYATGGAYHLRIGDFPVIDHPFPLAVRRGESTRVAFSGEDGEATGAANLAVPADMQGLLVRAAAKLPGAKSATWTTALVSDLPQLIEGRDSSGSSETASPIAAPVGINGCLDRLKERDNYRVQGVKGQTIRFASRTRSLGSAAVLVMRLFDNAGTKLAETAVTEADEWGFDVTFPDDAVYRLEVLDLLDRGGPGFGYWIEVRPAGSVSLALKPDAGTREQFSVEPEVGGAYLDVQIARFGYDGPLTLSVDEVPERLRLLNSDIPAGAAEARVHFVAGPDWTSESTSIVRLRAQAPGNPAVVCRTTGVALRRVKEPHVPFPDENNDVAAFLAGIAKQEPFFAMEPTAPPTFARPVSNHAVTLNLKRLKPEFKGGVTILGNALPVGWTVAAKPEQDVYQLSFMRTAEAQAEPASLPLLAVAEHAGRVRVETIPLAVQWIDPVQIALEGPTVLVPGQTAKIRASLIRAGEPGQVTLSLLDLPAGLAGPAEGVTVAADQSAAEIEIQVAPNAAPTQELELRVVASGKYGTQDFTVSAATTPARIVSAPVKLDVYPSDISLDDARARQQLVVTGFDAAGSPRDWTHDARIVPADPAIVEVRGGVVFPVAAGTTEIAVEAGGIRASVPVRVVLSATARPVAFESEVLVALSKQGCNSGACHGSPSGKGGFRLSLRAFDKQLDELTLIREDFGRRVNPLEPERSLLLAKPLMKAPHGGGMQLHKQDEAYAILREWIAGGAQPDLPDAPRCIRLEVYPPTKRTADLSAGPQQIAATAHFSDGSRRDVSHLVSYESSNNSVATIDRAGRVTPLARGETVILVRFLEHIESVPLMFIEEVDGFRWEAPPETNYVDSLVNEKLRQLRYLPSATCDDATFLRRLCLDLTGVLPTVEETTAFLADSDPGKRTKLIDRLLERDEYARFWALQWGDLLRMTKKAVGDEGVYKYHRWVEQAIRTNMPYDAFARALLTGSGSTLAEPPANFYRTAADMNDCVETVSQVFLGARLQCAKCHNHPFERWTQDNYYGLGAFFNRLQRRKTQRPGELFVYSDGVGEVTQPRTGQTLKPWLPRVGDIDVPAGDDRREAFARWLTSPENPFFARVEANRIWSRLFARGIVDPIDDFRDSNPPTNGPLLDALAKDFAENGFDRKHLLRTILNSRTYQADYQTNPFNEKDTLYFSHQQPRLLSAEQLLDAVNHAAGLSQAFAGLPPGTKATQLPAPDVVNVEFLKVFGQPERSTVCACERADDSNLGMAIELFNGSLIHEKLRDAGNRFRKAVAAGTPAEEIVREMYLASVCRPPSDAELRTALAHCRQRDDLASGLEDVQWALFNTDEFLFQH